MSLAAAFDAPVLRDLDEPARAQVSAAGALRRLAAGEVVYREGEPSESFFVVVSGAISLSAVRRGDAAASVLRVARKGDTFGEEASLTGLARRTTASADGSGAAEVAEIPVAVFRRVTGRAHSHAADRERRLLHRAATRDLLGTLAFTRDLADADLDAVLDAARLERFARGERVYSEGDAAADCFLVVDGLVQAQTSEDGRAVVRAYLARGDLFGDDFVGERALTAVAVGESTCLTLPLAVLRRVADRNPGLLERARRVAADKRERQAQLVGEVAAGSTQHVLKDLYRMHMARSLLVIDQDSCVRCGQCAWACAEVHGQSLLTRRGDKVVTQLGDTVARRPSSLLLPNSCQQCKNAACMIDCPTGAIARDPRGEVYIREELCTGCGNCAKACPWENIAMAPRAGSHSIAVKCDLCRGWEAPACVQSCPTESILRLEPARDFAEVGAILDLPSTAKAPLRRRASWLAAAVALGAAIAGVAAGLALQAAARLTPARGVGLAAGVVGGVFTLLAGAYALPKRIVRLWMRRRDRRDALVEVSAPVARSRVRPWFVVHLVVGLLAAAAVAAHAGARLPGSPAGMLHATFWAVVLVGGAGALAYRTLPSRLTRLERRGALPEDLVGERDALLTRLYREATGRSDLVKAIADNLLAPYARAPLGWLALLASGRSVGEEERRLRARIDGVLTGRGGGRLSGLDDLVRTVVELRALPARRTLTFLLGAWLPAHVVAGAALVALLVLHVVLVLT